jgi:hypothetical protein
MAKPTTYKGSALAIKVGNGANPEVFSEPCGLTTKGLNLSKATSDTTVPDCDNPDAPAWTERSVSSLSGTVSGSGVFTLEAAPVWRNFFLSTDSKNVQIWEGTLGHWQGKMHMTTLNKRGEIGCGKISNEVEFQSDGELTWVPAT